MRVIALPVPRFQSTLPARGATHLSSALSAFPNRHFNPRSPHGERRKSSSSIVASSNNFNPRSPHGERRWLYGCVTLRVVISIHAPRTGSDHTTLSGSSCQSLFQSTLPARGATVDDYHGWMRYLHFNPRSPHGERLDAQYWGVPQRRFQSTLPARGATRRQPQTDGVLLISIHAPRTGSDFSGGSRFATAFRFQSTLPARGATCRSASAREVHRAISIHAPRTGSDSRHSACPTWI